VRRGDGKSVRGVHGRRGRRRRRRQTLFSVLFPSFSLNLPTQSQLEKRRARRERGKGRKRTTRTKRMRRKRRRERTGSKQILLFHHHAFPFSHSPLFFWSFADRLSARITLVLPAIFTTASIAGIVLHRRYRFLP
jgi:hypothetical protein